MQTKSGKAVGEDRTTSRYTAAALTFASELIHLWVLPGEFVVRPLSGFFVLLVAACQGILAVSLLFGPSRWMVRFGILLNASVVSTWVVTRFVGVPMLFGFTRLPVELPSLAATAAEIVLLVLLFMIGREIKREPTREMRGRALPKTAKRKEGAR